MCRFSLLIGAIALFIAVGCGKKSKPAVEATPDKPSDTVVEDDLPKLPDVMKKIKSKSPEQRARGIADAGEIKNAATIAALIDALNDSSCSPLGEYLPEKAFSTREAAVMALVQQGPEGEKAVLDSGLKTLRAGLKDSDAAVREHTAYALAVLGSKAKAATDDLIALCSAKEKEIRRAAYTALEKIRTVPALPILQLLKNPEPEICRDAAETLTWLKPIPPEAVPLLIEVLKDDQLAMKDPATAMYIRLTAAEALGKAGPRAKEGIPVLIEVLKKTKVEELNLFKRPEESGALVALRNIGKPAVPALVELLNDPSPVVRYQAINVLGGMGPDAKEALEPLQSTVEKEFQRNPAQLLIVADGAMAQVKIGGDAAKAVEKLSELLKYDDPKIRESVVSILGMLGRNAASAVPAIIPLLDDPSPDVRYETARSLRRMGTAAKAAVPALTKKLGDRDADVRLVTLKTLRGFGPLAAEAVPELTKLLSDPVENVRVEALQTLKVVGPIAKSAVPELSKHLKTDSRPEKILLIELLGLLGQNEKPSVSELIALLSDKDREIEETALDALGRIGPVEPTVVPAVTAKLKANLMATRILAVKALARMGPGAKSAADELKNFGKVKDSPASIWAAVALARLGIDSDANVALVIQAMQKNKGGALRKAAMESAESLGTAGKAALPILLESLKEKDPISKSDDRSVRVMAATALGKMGPLAKDAVPKLTDLLKESDENLKKTVIIALGNIGSSATFAAARLREIGRNDKNLADDVNDALEKIEGKKE